MLQTCSFPNCDNEYPEHYFAQTCGAKHVFLGGTVGNNIWRATFIDALMARGIDEKYLFNPAVKVWDEEAQRREEAAKKHATFMVFYIASPNQDGNPLSAYSMVEATMALYDKPESTVVVFDTEFMEGHPLKAMKQAYNVLKARHPNAPIFDHQAHAIHWLAYKLKNLEVPALTAEIK